MPTVSVLMAVYNAEPYLDQALRSLLLDQTLTDLEVLAVDDASTDHSLATLEQWARRDERLRVFRQAENQGQAVARNVALQHAQGEFVIMLDADDWLSPDALERAVAVFRAHPQTDCVLFRLVQHWQADGREEEYPIPDFTVLTGPEAFRLSLDWTLHGLYMTRLVLHRAYPFDASYRLYSDDNTTHIHYLHSREVRPSAGCYYWRRHAQSTTTAISPLRFLHMMANLSLRQTLERENVAPDLLQLYDTHRWHVYRSQLWLYFTHRRALDKEARARVSSQLRQVYSTFPRLMPYPLFFATQWLRWLRRRLQGRL